MAKVSVVIPSRNEMFLAKTVDDIFAKAIGDIEVIVILDGPTTFSVPAERSNLIFIDKHEARGLKPAVNDGAKAATGKYLMKCDAHCIFGEGFDKILQRDCEDDWVVTATRKKLNADLWQPYSGNEVDYYYLGFPWVNRRFLLRNRHWKSKMLHCLHIPIDDQMAIHGSMWFMSRDHFYNCIRGLDEKTFGTFAGEPHEIALKTWLGGGRVVINKRTWYAHLQSSYWPRKYPLSIKKVWADSALVTHYWTKNKWEDRIHDFDWLIERFWRIPGWPENWREYYEEGLAK